ncbi:TlpA family protein disulfide reductase [Terrimonas sp.]|uniref:TlpA family protein disulfide reductase n=1 Tax=Terrimonas sp. TaxID=1914338 RepID=UPI000D52015A|nr:TlpA disulfide reductase family protein [Terrimonas sp.]PVD51923.1 TlpA family protein disulfide reductase [Terrimonas sp.]
MKHIYFFLLLVIFVYGCGNSVNNITAAPKDTGAVSSEAGKQLPSLSLKDVNGNTINLADFKGKKVFVNMWASWCPPCRAEMPSVQKLYEKTKDKNVQFAMIALDDNFSKSISFMKSAGLSMPVFYPDAQLPELLNVEAIPSTFIFNENGKLIKHIAGGDDYDTAAYLELLTQ